MGRKRVLELEDLSGDYDVIKLSGQPDIKVHTREALSALKLADIAVTTQELGDRGDVTVAETVQAFDMQAEAFGFTPEDVQRLKALPIGQQATVLDFLWTPEAETE